MIHSGDLLLSFGDNKVLGTLTKGGLRKFRKLRRVSGDTEGGER